MDQTLRNPSCLNLSHTQLLSGLFKAIFNPCVLNGTGQLCGHPNDKRSVWSSETDFFERPSHATREPEARPPGARASQRGVQPKRAPVYAVTLKEAYLKPLLEGLKKPYDHFGTRFGRCSGVFSLRELFTRVLGPFFIFRFFLLPAPLLLINPAFYLNGVINMMLADVLSTYVSNCPISLLILACVVGFCTGAAKQTSLTRQFDSTL